MSEPHAPCITPDGLLDANKFVCTDNMPLQTVLNILFLPNATARRFRISRYYVMQWLQRLATHNATAAMTLPEGMYLTLDHDREIACEPLRWEQLARTFQTAAATNARLVATLAVEETTHAVALAFSFRHGTLHVVDCHRVTMLYEAVLSAALESFFRTLAVNGYTGPARFSTRVSGDVRSLHAFQLEFACAPQLGLANDAIVKEESCVGWALLYMYALTHWSDGDCDLQNRHWYRCLARRLTGTTQPSGMQYYAVLLRFLTQLISTAHLVMESGYVTDRSLALYVETPLQAAEFKEESVRAALVGGDGSVTTDMFIRWFDQFAGHPDIASPGRDILLRAEPLYVDVPREYRDALRTLACPLFAFTAGCDQAVMASANKWYVSNARVPECVFKHLLEMAPGVVPDTMVVLTDANTNVLVTCSYSVFHETRFEATVATHTHDSIHAAVLVAVLVAFIVNTMVVMRNAPGHIVLFPSQPRDDVMACLHIRNSSALYVYDESDGIWKKQTKSRKRTRGAP